MKWAFGAISDAPVGFVDLGLANAIVGYLVFGAIGGLLDGLTLRALKKLDI